MIVFLSLINTICLFLIAFMHFYWSFGGSYGLQSVIPVQKEEYAPKLPSPFVTAIVAIIFLLCALPFLQKTGCIYVCSERFSDLGILVISICFLIRAIGEFKYVGFFKKITDTTFARNDTRLYSPFCLVFSVLGLIILAF